MGRRALVGEVGVELLVDQVVGGRVAVGGRALGGPHARELGERLVEPEVVPPAHRHDVAEPHVRHLVEQHVGEDLPLGRGRLAAAQHGVGPRHAAVVLHRTAEVRQEHLVVGALRERHAEAVAEELEALRGEGEELVGVAPQRGLKGLAGVEAELVAVDLAAHLRERPGHDDGVVRRQRRGGRERPAPGSVDVVDHRVAGVADHRPPGGGGDGEGVGRLQVGLVEAGPGIAGLVGLERRPQVDVVVGRVDGAVHAPAVGGVGLHAGDDQLVVLREPVQRDPPLDGGWQRRAVERRRLHLGAAVDEGRRAGGRGEAHRADGAEVRTVGQGGEVDGDVVGGDRQEGRALDGLLLSQAADGHGRGPDSSGVCGRRPVGRPPQPRPNRSADRGVQDAPSMGFPGDLPRR